MKISHYGILFAVLFPVVGFALLFGSGQTSSTNDIYLIPEGYEGPIQINYNIRGAPPLVKEGKFDVIPVQADGTYSTSKPDMEYGTVTDQYYYVSADGTRTPIDSKCVHVAGNGSYGTGDEIVRHNQLKITRTRCGDDFAAWGK